MKKIGDIMTRSLKTVRPTSTLIEVKQVMDENKIRHVVVTDANGALVGIASDRDIKKFISPFAGSSRESEQDKATLQIPIEKIMAKSPLTCTAEDPVKKAVEIMLQKKIHAIPIIGEKNKAVGIVSSSDMLKLLLSLL